MEHMSARRGERPRRSRAERVSAFLRGDYKESLEGLTSRKGLPWGGDLAEVDLYVELPFWLMMDPATVNVAYGEAQFAIEICSPQIETFLDEILDSRRSLLWRGPASSSFASSPPELQESVKGRDCMSRPCKTVLRLTAHGLRDAFDQPNEDALPGEVMERDAYWASLCEAHIPIINELIQRYRLSTYDYFAYEVSAWDVPIWFARDGGVAKTVVLMPYKAWDYRPMEIGLPPEPGGKRPVRAMQFTDGASLDSADSRTATPGEFDLLDARSLMERGDYTGALRRATTAIEAVVEWRLRKELLRSYAEGEVERRLKASENDFPGRLRQLLKLLGTAAPTDAAVAEFEKTRKIRHEIVHQGRRLSHEERGRAQRSVDTGRWLFNALEALPDRARLRDKGVLKSVGRVALAARFPTRISAGGVEVLPLGGVVGDGSKSDADKDATA